MKQRSAKIQYHRCGAYSLATQQIPTCSKHNFKFEDWILRSSSRSFINFTHLPSSTVFQPMFTHKLKRLTMDVSNKIKSQDAVAQWLTLFKASNSNQEMAIPRSSQMIESWLRLPCVGGWGAMGDPILMGNSWKNVADFFDFSARSGDLPSLQHRPCQRRGWKNSRGLSWLGWLHMTYLATLKERHTSSKALRLSEQEAAEVRFMEKWWIFPNSNFNGENHEMCVSIRRIYIYIYIQSHGSSWWFSLSADLIRLDGLVVCCLSRPRVNETCCPILSQVAQKLGSRQNHQSGVWEHNCCDI